LLEVAFGTLSQGSPPSCDNDESLVAILDALKKSLSIPVVALQALPTKQLNQLASFIGLASVDKHPEYIEAATLHFDSEQQVKAVFIQAIATNLESSPSSVIGMLPGWARCYTSPMKLISFSQLESWSGSRLLDVFASSVHAVGQQHVRVLPQLIAAQLCALSGPALDSSFESKSEVLALIVKSLREIDLLIDEPAFDFVALNKRSVRLMDRAGAALGLGPVCGLRECWRE
jgi:hypothetical protein